MTIFSQQTDVLYATWLTLHRKPGHLIGWTTSWWTILAGCHCSWIQYWSNKPPFTQHHDKSIWLDKSRFCEIDKLIPRMQTTLNSSHSWARHILVISRACQFAKLNSPNKLHMKNGELKGSICHCVLSNLRQLTRWLKSHAKMPILLPNLHPSFFPYRTVWQHEKY